MTDDTDDLQGSGGPSSVLSGTQVTDLARVLAAVAAAEDAEAVAAAATTQALAVLHADVASLSLLDPVEGVLRVVGAAGLGVTGADGSQTMALEEVNAVAEAARTARTVSASTLEEIRRRWPSTFSSIEGQRSLVAVPLISGGACVGVLALSFPTEQVLTEADLGYLTAVADTCALAIERGRAVEAAIDAATRLAFLADASAALASSLDYEVTLTVVADLAVPKLADWCTIDLLEDGRLRRVAISHLDPQKIELVGRLAQEFPTDMEASSGAPAVARTGVSELVEFIDAALLDRLGVEGRLRQVVEDLELTSALTVALRSRDRTLGVLSFVYAESRRRYRPEDVALAEDLARRAAVAIDNSQLHTETIHASLELQRAIKPTRPASGSIYLVGGHYRPAGRAEVGGDFYEAIELADGRLVVLVADVMGRGVSAAAWMTQLRSAIRAYVAVDPDPQWVCERLDRLLELYGHDGQIFTLCYALISPAGEALLVSAGHLPPVVVDASGGASLLEMVCHPPFGVGPRCRTATTVQLEPDGVLVLYSDGLVERRGESIDDGIARLLAHAPSLASDVSDRTVTALADRLRADGHDDDITVLAVRRRRDDQAV
jgi:serine phosphatase RsbU (regulator of sigma subunit)